MSHRFKLPTSLCAFALTALFAASPAAADRPSWVEGGKGHKPEKKSEERPASREAGKFHFDDDNRRVVHDYYSAKFRSGKCPPGLAKKKNGCLPPGQARKWAMGQPLPPDLKRYDLPHDLLSRLPVPSAGHSYVRVASDILLIAVGTGMVVDAIEDIGKQL